MSTENGSRLPGRVYARARFFPSHLYERSVYARGQIAEPDTEGLVTHKDKSACGGVALDKRRPSRTTNDCKVGRTQRYRGYRFKGSLELHLRLDLRE